MPAASPHLRTDTSVSKMSTRLAVFAASQLNSILGVKTSIRMPASEPSENVTGAGERPIMGG
jgi:hypothetical protein